jgi:mRNA interferase RelE/StbE
LGYSVILTGDVRKQLKKLDKSVARRIIGYLAEVGTLDDPRSRGKGLVGDRAGVWRYRVGDYRVLCEIQDVELVILTVEVGHRNSVYDG